MAIEHKSKNSGIGGKILLAAIDGLKAVEENAQSMDDFLDFQLETPEIRRSVSSLLFSYFRYKKPLEALYKKELRKPPAPEVKRLLNLALAQCLFQSGIAKESAVNIAIDTAKELHGQLVANFINAIMRKILRSEAFIKCQTEKNFASEEIFPDKVLKHWKKRFTPELINSFIDAFLTPAKFTYRLRPNYEPKLPGVEEKLDFAPEFRFFSSDEPRTILTSPELAEGKIYIQDPATAMAVSLGGLIAPGSKILDVCAAPGGKSLMLYDKMPAGCSLTALDRSNRRQELTRENFERCKIKENVKIISGTLSEVNLETHSFDLILLDVPCSNSGVFRRRPDALWRFDMSKMADIRQLQWEILTDSLKYLKAGGRIIYSTCSIESDENILMMNRFLREHDDFEIETELQLYPDRVHDGAYGCVLKQK